MSHRWGACGQRKFLVAFNIKVSCIFIGISLLLPNLNMASNDKKVPPPKVYLNYNYLCLLIYKNHHLIDLERAAKVLGTLLGRRYRERYVKPTSQCYQKKFY